METVHIILDGDDCWPDLQKIPYINAMGSETKVGIACLPGGMASGACSVTFRIDAPTGETLLFETSLRLLKRAVEAFEARYGSVDA